MMLKKIISTESFASFIRHLNIEYPSTLNSIVDFSTATTYNFDPIIIPMLNTRIKFILNIASHKIHQLYSVNDTESGLSHFPIKFIDILSLNTEEVANLGLPDFFINASKISKNLISVDSKNPNTWKYAYSFNSFKALGVIDSVLYKLGITISDLHPEIQEYYCEIYNRYYKFEVSYQSS